MILAIRLVVCLILLPIVSLSQGIEVISTQRTLLNLTRDSRLSPLMDLKDVKGSPFLEDSFAIGIVYSNKGQFPGVELRYNIYNDLMEFKQKGQIFSLAPVPPIEKVVLGDLTFVVLTFKNDQESSTGYFQELDTGYVCLYSKMNIIFKEKEEPKPMSYSGVPAKFTRLSDSYFLKIDNQIVRVSSTKKIIDYFPSNNEQIKSFIKDNNLSLKNETDLIKVVKYFNSIKSE